MLRGVINNSTGTKGIPVEKVKKSIKGSTKKGRPVQELFKLSCNLKICFHFQANEKFSLQFYVHNYIFCLNLQLKSKYTRQTKKQTIEILFEKLLSSKTYNIH